MIIFRPFIFFQISLFMKNQLSLLIIFFFYFSSISFSQSVQEEKIISGMHGISSHNLNAIVIDLASEKFAGRLTGTPTYDSAALYLASFFKTNGIEAKGEDNSYFQKFKIPYTEVYKERRLSLHLPMKRGETLKE